MANKMLIDFATLQQAMQTIPIKVQRYTFILLSIFTFISELHIQNLYNFAYPANFYLILVLALLLVLNAYFAPFFEFAFIAVFFSYLLVKQVIPESAIFAFYCIVIYWFIRAWYYYFAILIVSYIFVYIWLSSDLLEALLTGIINMLIITATAFIIAVTIKRVRETTRAEYALQTIQAELANQLHNTVAKDLATIAILTEKLKLDHPELDLELTQILDSTYQASRKIQPIIQSLKTTRKAPSVNQTVENVKLMLTTRSMSLDVEYDQTLETITDPQLKNLVCLFIREAGTNCLKYGKSGTLVKLVLATESNTITLLMENKISTKRIASELTGGYGLVNLQQNMTDMGGEVLFTQTDECWRIIGTLPVKGVEK